MTLGEKIRQARHHAGLSQEQLAERMCVSRSAVAKWEAGKGIPDIENLKLLSRLLGVSLDALLEEDSVLVIREPVELAAWGRGCKKVKKDRIIRAKYPAAAIYSLLGQLELGKADMSIGNVKGEDKEFYLVEQAGRQLFVMVTDTYLESRPMEPPIREERFSLDSWCFIKCTYEVEKA